MCYKWLVDLKKGRAITATLCVSVVCVPSKIQIQHYALMMWIYRIAENFVRFFNWQFGKFDKDLKLKTRLIMSSMHDGVHLPKMEYCIYMHIVV